MPHVRHAFEIQYDLSSFAFDWVDKNELKNERR